MKYLYVDTETTGLDPYRHEVWEVGAIEEDDTEHHWFLPVDFLHMAEPIALSIGGFHQRYPGKGYKWRISSTAEFATEFYELGKDKCLVGAVPSFDEERLRKILHSQRLIHTWHYHLLDIESMALGYMVSDVDVPLPWKYDVVKEYFRGSEIPGTEDRDIPHQNEKFDPYAAKYAQHTALGDARLVRDLHRIMRGR